LQYRIDGFLDIGQFKNYLLLYYYKNGVKCGEQTITLWVRNRLPIQLATDQVAFSDPNQTARIAFKRNAKLPWYGVRLLDSQDIKVSISFDGSKGDAGVISLTPNIQGSLSAEYSLGFANSTGVLFRMPIHVKQLYSSINVVPRVLYFGNINSAPESSLEAIVTYARKGQRCINLASDSGLISVSYENVRNQTIVRASVDKGKVRGPVKGRLTMSLSGAGDASCVIPYFVTGGP
jgi:hypothetical protein